VNRENFDYSCMFLSHNPSTPLKISARWGGHQQTCSSDYDFNGMYHGNQELALWQYTISGFGVADTPEGVFNVEPGSAFLLTIPDKHRYYLPEKSTHWEFLFLGFSGSEAIRLAKDMRQKYSPVSNCFAQKETVALAEMLIDRGIKKELTDPFEISTLSYQFFMTMAREAQQPGELAGDDPVMLFHRFCLRHLAEELSLEDLAAAAGYSRSHFCRIFRSRTGKSPHHYLLELRMKMAESMLSRGNASVKETAAACGFADTSYFCKVFRRFYGASPAKLLLHRDIRSEA